MHPVPYPPTSYEPFRARPDSRGSGPSRPPFAGTVWAALGTLGLLVTATAGAAVTVLLYTSGHGWSVNAPVPVGLTGLTTLACGGLLTSVVLLGGGHDAGRSATVWLAGAAVPWTLGAAVLYGFYAFDDFFAGGVRLAALLGVAGATVAVVALPAAAILLGRSAARYPPTGGIGGAPGPPAVLRAAPGRFRTALGVVVAADFGLVVAWPPRVGTDDVTWGWAVVEVVVLLLVHGVPLALAGVGATSARAGRRGGAVAARAFGAVCLLVLPITAFYALILPVEPDPDATEAAVFSALMLGFAGGAGLVLTGLAALADPGSEQHYRAAGTRSVPSMRPGTAP
ncbi:hypothetical protein [Cryptosporangium sp. NPDC051539]|uniref:hypothetical protein n=1 Tax=Cryptosporangium sp. NPDC051539 TaxID=3363962 RepID=UPI0037917807